MSESHKQVSRRFTELFSTDDVSRADEVFAPDVVFHGLSGGDLHGIEAVKAFIAAYRAAFPDAISTVEDQVAEGDRVVTRMTAIGTHEGDLPGAPATGNKMEMTAITIHRIEDGRLAEKWSNKDVIALLEQIGVMPPHPEPGAAEA